MLVFIERAALTRNCIKANVSWDEICVCLAAWWHVAPANGGACSSVLGVLVEGLFFQGVLNALIPLYLMLNPRRNKSRDGKHVLWSVL